MRASSTGIGLLGGVLSGTLPSPDFGLAAYIEQTMFGQGRRGGTPTVIYPSALALTNTHILVGNAANIATDVAVSGSGATITMSATGVITISAIAPGSISLTSAHLLVGNGSNVAADVAMSGAVSITNTGLTALTSSAFANPSASVGLTAVNGTATTAMRSDGAPPIDQGIAPTWTSLHIFTLGVELIDEAAPSAPSSGRGIIGSFNQQGFSVPHWWDPLGHAYELLRDILTTARNTSGSTIGALKAVYVTGSTGATPTFSLAKADSILTMPALGITTASVANNGYTQVMLKGNIENVDLSAFSNGDELYVDAATAGNLTNVRPATLAQFVGTVLNNGVGNGVLNVDIQNQFAGRYETVNAQTGASYTFLNSDLGRLVTFNHATAVAVALAQAGSSGFLNGWYVDCTNLGAGTATVTPTTSTINGAATYTLTTGQSVRIVSDGTNYQVTAIGSGGGSGTVTSVATDSTLTGGPITTTGTLGINLANANTWTAAQTVEIDSIGDAISAGVTLENTTAGTLGTPVQASPALILTGHVYDLGSSGDKTKDWAIWNEPGSANPSVSTLIFSNRTSGGSFVATAWVDNLGTFSCTSSRPSANDGGALGSTGKQWSDLFLASGGVINWANGNFTATHSSGALAFSGSISASNLSGTNTGDQTITLTGAVTGSGTGSFATTIATPGTLSVSSSNSTATAHTHAITSSSAPGAAASLLATDSSGIIGSTGTRIVKGWFIDLTVTNAISGSVTGNAGTATALASARTLWGQSFDGTADVTGSLTAVGNITGGASSMTITAGTGNSRTLALQSTTSGGVATTFLTGNADQSSTFGGNISGTGAWTLTGGAGNMTIVSGTGNSRTLTLQTTTSGGTATTAILIGADQSSSFSGTLSGSAGAFALSFGSFTGNTTLPTGNISWTGASTKTASLVSNGGAITITAGAASTWSTSSGTLNIDSAAALDLGPTNTTSVAIGNSAHCSKISFTTTTGGSIAFPGTTPMLLGVGGRLGLDSNFVSTSDLTAKLVLNWNAGGPFGDRLPVFDGTNWNLFQSGQLTIKATDSAQTGGSITGTTITGLTSTAQLVPGMKLSNSTGTGTLAANTVISTITSATAITVNNAASVNGTLTNLTFKLPASTAYDVILVNDGGTLRLLWGPAWSTSTGSSAARASALTTQNGLQVNSGSWTTGFTNNSTTVANLTGLYLGTVLVSATDGQLADSHNYRGVWNNYNRHGRKLTSTSSAAARSMASTTPEFFMNDSTQFVVVMIGLIEDQLKLDFRCIGQSAGLDNAVIGFGVDTTANLTSTTINAYASSANGSSFMISACYYDYPGIGGHTFNLLERSGAGGTVTFNTANSVGGIVGAGCVGEVWA